MLFEIKNRWDGAVLFSLECGSLKLCVEAAVKSSADLRSANLRSADLRSANLRFADLRFADLRFADLSSADLRSADLRSADLRFADLRSADLSSAKWPNNAVVLRAPIHIFGLRWPVLIFGSHMQIGCEVHAMREWEAFDDARILKMEANQAVEFWRQNKTRLLAFRDDEAEMQFSAKQLSATAI